jgi:hypothetical protein
MNDKIKRMTSKKCEEWALNPTINPLSGASIDPAAPTGVYRKIAERCATFGITPNNVPLLRQRQPKTVGGYHVPQNEDELPEFIDILKNAINAFELSEGTISDNSKVRNSISALVLIVKLISDVRDVGNGYIPLSPSQAIIVAKFMYIFDSSIIYWTPAPLESVATSLRIELDRVLINPLQNAHTMKHFLSYMFKYKFLNLPEDATFKEAKKIYGLLSQFYKQNEKVNRERGEVATFSISDTKSRSLPQSISQERYVTRRPKPKQRFITREIEVVDPVTGRPETHTVRVPDPSEPDAFVENVFL